MVFGSGLRSFGGFFCGGLIVGRFFGGRFLRGVLGRFLGGRGLVVGQGVLAVCGLLGKDSILSRFLGGLGGTLGLGQGALRSAVERAVGSNILEVLIKTTLLRRMRRAGRRQRRAGTLTERR